MKLRLTITYVLNLIDLVLTMYYVSLFGLIAEANPIGRWLISSGLVYFYKIAIVGGLLLAIGLLSKNDKKFANTASWILLLTFNLLTMYHCVTFASLIA